MKRDGERLRRIELRPPQLRKIAELNAEAAKLQTQLNAYLAGVLSSHVDPEDLVGWNINVEGGALVLTPPQELPREAGAPRIITLDQEKSG